MDLMKAQNRNLGIRTDGNHAESVVFKELYGSNEQLLRESKISEMLGQHGEQE